MAGCHAQACTATGNRNLHTPVAPQRGFQTMQDERPRSGCICTRGQKAKACMQIFGNWRKPHDFPSRLQRTRNTSPRGAPCTNQEVCQKTTGAGGFVLVPFEGSYYMRSHRNVCWLAFASVSTMESAFQISTTTHTQQDNEIRRAMQISSSSQ